MKSLLKVGDNDLVFKPNSLNEMTALYYNCVGRQCRSELKVIEMLVEKGGKKLIFIIDRNGGTAFHYACEHLSRSCSWFIDVINRLIAVDGKPFDEFRSSLSTTFGV